MLSLRRPRARMSFSKVKILNPSLLSALLSIILLAELTYTLPAARRSNTGDDGNLKIYYDAPSQHYPTISYTSDAFPTSGRSGVVSEIDVCSNVGATVLKEKGGSAADAIVATVLCVGSIASLHSGIGGGGHILAHDARAQGGKGDSWHIDMREMAPSASYASLYTDAIAAGNADASTVGGLAVGVPGELKGLHAIWSKWGKLPWADLFRPAIEINTVGFKVPNQLAYAIATSTQYVCKGYFEAVFCPGGNPAVEGQTITRPTYAKTLAKIAEHGPEYFYSSQSPLAQRTIAYIQKEGGIMTNSDLEGYSEVWRKPTYGQYRSHRLISTSAPSSGPVVVSALQTLDAFRLTGNAKSDEYDLTTHRAIEATKFAQEERLQYGDPAYHPLVLELEKNNTQLSHALATRKKIDDTGVLPFVDYQPPALPSNASSAAQQEAARRTIAIDRGTSHVVVSDLDGLTITLTTTVNAYFGSKLMTVDGIILNNQMDDFDKPPANDSSSSSASGSSSSSSQSSDGGGGNAATSNVYNYPLPGARPLSSISPTIAIPREHDQQTDVRLLATGSAGGVHIPATVIQIIASVLDKEAAVSAATSGGQISSKADWIQDAIDSPRWFVNLPTSAAIEAGNATIGVAVEYEAPTPGIASAEAVGPKTWRGFSNETASYLASLGDTVSFTAPGSSTAQGLMLLRQDDGTVMWKGGAENRQTAARAAAVP